MTKQEYYKLKYGDKVYHVSNYYPFELTFLEYKNKSRRTLIDNWAIQDLYKNNYFISELEALNARKILLMVEHGNTQNKLMSLDSSLEDINNRINKIQYEKFHELQ